MNVAVAARFLNGMGEMVFRGLPRSSMSDGLCRSGIANRFSRGPVPETFRVQPFGYEPRGMLWGRSLLVEWAFETAPVRFGYTK